MSERDAGRKWAEGGATGARYLRDTPAGRRDNWEAMTAWTHHDPAVRKLIQQAQARVLREVAAELHAYAWTSTDGRHMPAEEQAAYVAGANDAHEVADRFLHQRADQIEETP